MLDIFYACGLRRSEGVGLNLEDIAFDKKYLHVRKTKNNKERFVPFTQRTAHILHQYLHFRNLSLCKNEEEKAFFLSIRGDRIDGQSLLLRLKKLQMLSTNIPLKTKRISLHSLRHSIATHLMQNGMTLKDIGQFLGHSTLDSTQIYTHLI